MPVGSPLSPSGSQPALAITRGHGVSPCQLLGVPVVAVSPLWALLTLSIGGEGRERAKQHQLELEARLGAWKKWQDIKLDH